MYAQQHRAYSVQQQTPDYLFGLFSLHSQTKPEQTSPLQVLLQAMIGLIN